MRPLATDRLERAVATLDDAERAALLAAVWTARGYEVTTAAGVVAARRAGEGVTRVAASPSVVGLEEGVDAVLVVGRERRRVPAGAGTLSARGLRRLLLYAVERERGTVIAREHLGVPLLVHDPDPDSAPRSGWVPGVARDGRATALALAAGVVVAGVVVASLVAGVPVPGASAPTPTPTPTPADGDGDGAGDEGNGVGAESGAVTPTESPYPPGLSRDGVEDAGELGQAHALALSGQSYRLVVRTDGVAPLTHPGQPFDPGVDRWGEVYQRASVANATNYDYRLGGTCTPVGEDEPVLVRRSAYADGVAEYSRSNVGGTVTRDARSAFARILDGGSTSPSVARSRRGVPDVRAVLVPEGRVGLLEVRAAGAVERLFGTPNSTIRLVRVNSSARYLLTGTGRPPGLPGDVANYSLAARVRDDGLLEAFTVAYTYGSASGRESVSVSVEYHEVGRTAVDPPGWFEAAGGAAGFPVQPTDAANGTLLGPRRCGLPVSDG